MQSAFGHRELDRTRLRIDKPDNRLARLNPLVVVGIDFLDGTRERRDQLRVGQNAFRVVVSRARPDVGGFGRLVVLTRNRLPFDQPLVALELRLGRQIGSLVGLHLQHVLAGIDLGDDGAFLDALAFRNVHFDDLARLPESQVRNVVGRRHASEILVYGAERFGRESLDGSGCRARRLPRRRIPAAAHRGGSGKEQQKSVSHSGKPRSLTA